MKVEVEVLYTWEEVQGAKRDLGLGLGRVVAAGRVESSLVAGGRQSREYVFLGWAGMVEMGEMGLTFRHTTDFLRSRWTVYTCVC